MNDFVFSLTDFPNGRVVEGALHVEVAADPTVGAQFLFVERRGTVVTLHFSSAVEELAVRRLIEAHQGIDPPPPPELKVSGTIDGVPVVAIIPFERLE